jgi:hypothetical protein
MKTFKSFGFMLKNINPHKLTEIVYEAYIIIFFGHWTRGQAPTHLRKQVPKELQMH